MCPPCVGCSEVEQKVDQLTKMTDEVIKRQLEWEDTAQKYKRYFFNWDAWTCIRMTI